MSKTPGTADPSTATAAYLRAQRPGEDALFWLQRAKRLAPKDPRIDLELAQRELAAGPDGARRAAARFAEIAAKHDSATAWIGLAIAAQIQGDAAAAARAAEELLARHCLGEDPQLPAFLQHISLNAGYGGFQGMDAQGTRVQHGQPPFLGAPPDEAVLNRIEGVVEAHRGGLRGWAVRPAAPDQKPRLIVTGGNGARLSLTCGAALPADDATPLLPRYRFSLTARRLAGLTPPYLVSGADGRALLGAPMNPADFAQRSRPAARRGKAPSRCPRRARLAIIMPVYRGLEETRAALASARRALPPGARLIVVDDATPEPALAALLNRAAKRGQIELLRHEANRGFCDAVNTGLGAAKNHDVILLNSDVLVPKDAFATLREVAYAAPCIGTVTPLSNEATLCSYPDPAGGNAMPDLAGATRLDRLAHKTNGLGWAEIPTGVGFCLYIRHDCLQQTGALRTALFAQGYGEENDFCLRARHLGFASVAALGAYVAHRGGVSFRGATQALMRRNQAVLEQLFPGYRALIEAASAADALAPARAALDAARLQAARAGRRSVLLISHGHGGGVARQIERVCAALRAQGKFPLVLTTKFPTTRKAPRYPWPALLCDGHTQTSPNLTFDLARQFEALLALLRGFRVERVEMHHMLGQHEALRGLAAALGVRQDIVLHDYASFCPRVSLLNRPTREAPLRYCGEPDVKGCETCVKQDRRGVFETLPVQRLLARSRAEFAGAREVRVPSGDMARRLARHFPGLKPRITAWDDDSQPVSLRPPRTGARRIAVLGGIGPTKGYDVLLDCALDAKARALPLEFFIIGSSAEDGALLEAGVKITGGYKPEELDSLIAEIQPDLAFLPSICPETWCFTLTEAWAAGLYALVFDLGAQAERVRATQRGAVLPLGLPAERINNALLGINF
ncbi:glycosyltransferase [Acidocella facilis]|uniref:glycosyltransferase n=1 Tax=Acidocella facilis TaxID=525 RepID=UPI001F2DF73F|nr:glycosyltransferase [Acidocella facilis]